MIIMKIQGIKIKYCTKFLKLFTLKKLFIIKGVWNFKSKNILKKIIVFVELQKKVPNLFIINRKNK